MDSPVKLTAVHSGTFLRLQKIITRSHGFHALIGEQNQPLYRDGLIQQLNQAVKQASILDLKDWTDFNAFEQTFLKKKDNSLIHLINLESLKSEQQQAFFRGLNYHREYLAEKIPCHIVFWMSRALIKEMALQAPDFWAWREQVFDFSLVVETPRLQPQWSRLVNLNSPEKQKRITEINAFLAKNTPDGLIKTDLKQELARLYRTIGDYKKSAKIMEQVINEYQVMDEVLSANIARRDLARIWRNQGELEQAFDLLNQKVLPLFKQLNNQGEIAETYGTIACILQVRGKFDKALEIRQKEELPIFEQLGDIHLKAISMGQIADILQARGEFDKALTIRQKEVLPIYEQLGDVRSKALTMGKITDILQTRGEFDKALTILQKEVLPIFEQLGDIHSKAVTMGKIADILQARGELDKALTIRQKEELPIYEKLGATRKLLITKEKLAVLYWQKDPQKYQSKVQKLLSEALADAIKMKLPEAERIKERWENVKTKYHAD